MENVFSEDFKKDFKKIKEKDVRLKEIKQSLQTDNLQLGKRHNTVRFQMDAFVRE